MIPSLIMLLGCAKVVEIDGYKLNERYASQLIEAAKTRAAFDSGCPANQLEVTVLTASNPTTPAASVPDSVGVVGCGKRLTYTRVPGRYDWILSSLTDR